MPTGRRRLERSPSRRTVALSGKNINISIDGYARAHQARNREAGAVLHRCVGAVEWYGVAAKGAVKVGGRTIKGVQPLLLKDGSDFYVSATSLVDKNVPDNADHRRNPNPLRLPAAVVPRTLTQQGIALGSFGAAMPYNHQREGDVAVHAQVAFKRWGGEVRRAQCLQALSRP